MNQIPETIKNTIQTIIEGLTPLAQKLGIATEFLFKWAVKHNYAVAATDLLPPIALIVFGIMTWKCIKHALNIETQKESRYDYDQEVEQITYVIVSLVLGIMSFAMFIISIDTLPNAISRFIAPEWHTTQDIINLIRDKPNTNVSSH